MEHFSGRRYIVVGLVFITVLVFLIRLFQLQVLDRTYRLTAANNVLRYEMQYPSRGLIYDRNGVLLVENEAAYDLMINPRQLAAFDTLDFCQLLDVTREQVVEAIKSAREYSLYKPSPFVKQISARTYAIFQEKMYKFPGFFVQPRTLRKYNVRSAAHVLGYVGEVDEGLIEANSYYSMGDYIGISGIEKTYEEELRGQKGTKVSLVDVHNRTMGEYMNGRFDTMPNIGTNITLTMDSELQAYGEQLMSKMRGSIVAIQPATGEILSLVSMPSYNPSLLVGRIRSENYSELSQDTLKPLFNRALMAQYPPGSTFKVINALIGLQEQVVGYHTKYYCDLGYHAGRITVGCHMHDSPLNLPQAIQNSCNAYFCNVFRSILDNPKYENIHASFEAWKNHARSFGFGNILDTDFANELRGNVPESSYYDGYYGANGWKSLTLLSMAIGQGELLITPIQMANMAATISNRGYYNTPHMIKDGLEDKEVMEKYLERHHTTIDSVYFATVIEGMEMAVNGPPGSGSTARIARLPEITICGKTGTAENPHGEDHSIFIAFAPKDNPEIAIAVYVENAGFGTTYAAPIASLMIEQHLTDTIKRKWLENYILEMDLLNNSEQEE